MKGRHWEIKSHVGHGKRTINNQVYRALKQSKCVIMDCQRTKLSDVFIERDVRRLINRRTLEKLIMIRKNKEVLEIL